MKYAVIEHGGKQYLAREGDAIEVDRMALDVGKTVEFKEILLLVDGRTVKVGSPKVEGGRVKGKVASHLKANKVVVFKYRPKQRYRRKQGHRQPYTRIEIDSISMAQPKAAAEKPVSKPEAAGETTEKKPAVKRTATTKKTTGAKPTPKKTAPRKTSSTGSKSSSRSRGTPKKPAASSSRSNSSRKKQSK